MLEIPLLRFVVLRLLSYFTYNKYFLFPCLHNFFCITLFNLMRWSADPEVCLALGSMQLQLWQKRSDPFEPRFSDL